MRIPLAKSDIGPAEADAVARVMASGRLARGDEISAFETEFAAWHGVKDAAMTNSGTSALTCALRACGVGLDDEVIVPAFTFIGTVNAILQCGARPVLVDVQAASGNLNLELAAAAVTDRTRAIVPVHVFGAVADISELRAIGTAVAVIEDAAEATGSESDGRRAGTRGDAGIFGFYPNKPLTTGEGGMVISDDIELVERCRALANQGGFNRSTTPGYSFRATELAAAIGRAQLRTLKERLADRMRLAAEYHNALQRHGLSVFGYDETKRGWFTCPVLLESRPIRDHAMEALNGLGIETANYFPPVHTSDAYRDLANVRHPVTVSESLSDRMISLPFWPNLPHVEEICDALAGAIG